MKVERYEITVIAVGPDGEEATAELTLSESLMRSVREPDKIATEWFLAALREVQQRAERDERDPDPDVDEWDDVSDDDEGWPDSGYWPGGHGRPNY